MITFFTVALITFSLGAGIGWIGPSIKYFSSSESSFYVSEEEVSWIASIYFFAEFLTPVLAIICSTKVGRKPILTIGAFFATISWAIIAFTRSAIMVIIARTLLGMCAGFHDITWSIYLAEYAEPDNRGVISSGVSIIMVGGILAQTFLSLFLSYEVLAIIPLTLAVIGFLWCFNMVESPYLLLMHKKETQALKTLTWLRDASSEEVWEEFNEIMQYTDQEKRNKQSIKLLLGSFSEYRVYLVCVAVFGFIMFNGYMTLITFMGKIMDPYDGIPSGNEMVFFFGLVSFVSIFLSSMIIERVGRKVLLMVGFLSSTVVLWGISFFFYVEQHKPFTISFHIPQILVLLFAAIAVIFSLTIGSTAYVIRGELFPQRLRVIGSAASTMFNGTIQFVLLRIFIPIWNTFGIYVNFLIYSVFCILISFCIYFLLPETRGKTLVEIQRDIVVSADSTNKTEQQPPEVLTTLI